MFACISKTTLVKTNKTKTLETKQKQQKYSSSSQKVRDIYSWSSGGLDVLYVLLFVFLEGFLLLFLLPFLFVVFLPSMFKLLPEHNTIHYTKHKDT